MKRQKWEKLLKRRDLMHVEAYKEFHKNLTVSLSKKKEVVRSSVRGVNIELDSMILASILGVPGNNGICEYIKEVWKESKFCKPLEITKKFANNDLITVAKRVKSTEMKPFQRFLHFIVMKNLAPRFGKRDTTKFMDLTYMDHSSTRRRDDEDEAPAKNVQNKEGSADVSNEVLEVSAPVSDQQKEKASIGVDPSVPTGSIPDLLLQHYQAELDRARADRLQVELDKARAENPRLQALLRQASSQPKP
ncbi:hypothetical protein Dimus_031889 [Dionaea muscipula]